MNSQSKNCDTDKDKGIVFYRTKGKAISNSNYDE